MTRSLQVEAFDVVDGCIVAVDSVLPVVVELDLAGSATSIWQWDLDTTRRGRPTAKDVLLTATDIVVASPAAGGLVRINRETGATQLVPMDEDIGWLVRDGETVWAIADPNREGAYEAFLASPDLRSVVWEEPTAADMERFRARMSGWMGRAPDSDDEWVPLVDSSDPIPSAADWQDNDDDEAEHIGPPTPVWRVDGYRATRVDVGGELAGLASTSGRVVAVCQLPSDPLIKAVQPGGYLSYIRPGTVLVGDGATFRPIGTVAESSGTIVVDGQDAWLLGFNRERDDESFEIRRVDVVSGTMSDPMPAEREVLAIVRGRMVALAWNRNLAGPHQHDFSRPDRVVRITSSAGQTNDVAVPHLEDSAVVDGSTVWLRALDEPKLIGIEVDSGEVREIPVRVDLAEYVPSVAVPDGFDAAAFEFKELESLRSAFFGEWRSDSGEQHSFIRRVTFESVELEGSFPNTAVVAMFRSADRPGIEFGRRWRLYDDLGNAEPLEYVDINLMEDIEAAGYGLPPLGECQPDQDGIVWF